MIDHLFLLNYKHAIRRRHGQSLSDQTEPHSRADCNMASYRARHENRLTVSEEKSDV